MIGSRPVTDPSAAGSVRSTIKPSRYKCSGKVEVYFEGQWLAVSGEALQSPAAQSAICREAKCGGPLKVIEYAGLQAPAGAIAQIQCRQDGVFRDCNSSVAGPGSSFSALGGLKCSGMF